MTPYVDDIDLTEKLYIVFVMMSYLYFCLLLWVALVTVNSLLPATNCFEILLFQLCGNAWYYKYEDIFLLSLFLVTLVIVNNLLLSQELLWNF